MVEIFSKTIRLSNGRVLHAKDYGLKAFRFKVSAEEHAKVPEGEEEVN